MAHGNTQTHTHTYTHSHTNIHTHTHLYLTIHAHVPKLTKKWKYTENQNLSEDPALLYIDQLISHTKAFPSSKLVLAAARNPKGINRAAAAKPF